MGGRCGRKIFTGVDELIALEPVLLIIEMFVTPFSREQLIVRAALDDLAAFEHQYLVGAADG